MSIEEQIQARYPVIFEESQCRTTKRHRDGLRDAMRERLMREAALTYETKEGQTVAPVERDWFGRVMETKSAQSATDSGEPFVLTLSEGVRPYRIEVIVTQ